MPKRSSAKGNASAPPNPQNSYTNQEVEDYKLDQVTTVIGFDYGARRIGVAMGNRVSHSARALDIVGNGANGPDWKHVDVLLRDWRPDALLVGLPLTLDSGEQHNSLAARQFAAELHRRHKMLVLMVDERLSSREAAHRFAERRASGALKRKDAAALDAVAAEIIVEQWLREDAAKTREP